MNGVIYRSFDETCLLSDDTKFMGAIFFKILEREGSNISNL